MEVSKYVCK